MTSPYGILEQDMDKLRALKKTVEALGYELEIVKKSAEDVTKAWNALPPEFQRAIGDIKITVEFSAAAPVEAPRYTVIAKANQMRRDMVLFSTQALRRMAEETPGYWFDEESEELRAGIGSVIYDLSGDSQSE